MTSHSPTAFVEVNAVLAELLSGLQSVLGEQFVGLYLYGSLAAGGFDPRRSDVDFLVITQTNLPDEMLTTLESMHARITSSGMTFARRMEGVYIPINLLPRYERDKAVHPCLCCGGEFYAKAQQDSDWIIQRHILREHGVIVAGPPIRPLIDRVKPDDLRGAVRGFVHEWWAPMLNNPARLRDREYQAYAILTFCRVLYTLKFGEIGSKSVSAYWAQQTLESRWSGAIDRALSWPDGLQPDEFEETVELLRYVIQKSST